MVYKKSQLIDNGHFSQIVSYFPPKYFSAIQFILFSGNVYFFLLYWMKIFSWRRNRERDDIQSLPFICTQCFEDYNDGILGTMSKFVPKKIVPYDDFEQVILVFRPEWVVQSQHMEWFFFDRIWTKFGHGSLVESVLRKKVTQSEKKKTFHWSKVTFTSFSTSLMSSFFS